MHYFRDQKRTLMYVLLLVNFSWALPYSRTLFSSEMMSSLFFFGTLLLYEYKKDKDPSFILLLLIGFLFSLSFYFRFQIAFSMAGLAVWLLFFEKRYKHVAPLLAGFAAGTAMNVVLDYGFYKEWVFTPYSYFYANIIDGRADYFGRSSFLRYIGLILLVAPAPLFSFVLFYYMLKNSVRYYTNPVIISVVLFVIFHSIVGHKEERFLFPVFNVFPLLIGWSILEVQKILTSSRYVLRNIARFLLWSTIVLNTVLLIVMTTVPFSQTILFSKKLSNRFKGEQAMIYCIGQSPFETPSGNQMEFYKIASRNISVRKIKIFNPAILMREQPEFIATPYNSVKEHFANLDNLGYKPVLASSSFLWKLNELLDRNEMTTINEIWMLYQKQ
jgi:phosphatidylinositol glycan class B